MKITTATSLRKDLFHVLERAILAVPTRVRTKLGDAVIISYKQFLALKETRGKKSEQKVLRPLVTGIILKPLDESADEELMDFMGLDK